MIKWETTSTPRVCFIDGEKSATIMKFFVKREDGTTKEYVLATTKEGKLILH